MIRWLDSLRTLQASGEPAMLVTITDVRGSAPRECGARMLVTASETIGTIGGGQLEYQCTRLATAKSGTVTFLQRFPLGANCGQCCGGVVEVLFENLAGAAWVPDLLRYYQAREPVVLATALAADGQVAKFIVTAGGFRAYSQTPEALETIVVSAGREMLRGSAKGAKRLAAKETGDCPLLLEPVMSSNFNLALFGAGHVGSAVVAALAGLDCNIRWIDSRRGIFPARVPANVTCLESDNPQHEVAAMPPGSFCLVMTHSHPLDFDICARVLERGDFAYCGLIGSVSKRRRFEKLMRRQQMPDVVLNRLTCPVGIRGIDSKKPEAIAIAVAAELLQTQSACSASRETLHLVRAL